MGGPADVFAVPQDVADLLELLRQLETTCIPWFVIGGGYNLLVADSGFRGVAISLQNLDKIAFINNLLYAEAGATNQSVAAFARDHGLSGLEFLAGIPGTLGGAVRMNAGANGCELFDRVVSVQMLSHGDNVKHAKYKLNFNYRRLQLDPEKIIIAAEMSCIPAPVEAIAGRMEEFQLRRQKNQRVGFPNAGSFFKNPSGHAAWQLIDAAGLRGFSVGGAQVSEVHTNFLVNRGSATAADFQKLACIVKERVLQQSGVQLEEEVITLGGQSVQPK